MTAAELSRVIGAKWADETPEVKARYAKLAKESAKLHAAAYPDYRYSPRKRDSRSARAVQAAKSAQAALKLTASSMEFASRPALTSQYSQECPTFMRIPNSYPYSASKVNNTPLSTSAPSSFFTQPKRASGSFQVNHGNLTESSFQLPPSRIKKRASSRSPRRQPKAMTTSPSLFFVSHHDQKPLVPFVPSVPSVPTAPSTLPTAGGGSGLHIGLTAMNWPESIGTVAPLPGLTGAHPSLMSMNSSNYVYSSAGNLNMPSYSSEEEVPSSIYLNQLMNADITAAMGMNPPSRETTHKSSSDNSPYVQPVSSDIDYQALIFSGLPCPIPKYTQSSHEQYRGFPMVRTESVFLSPAMMEQDMDVSPVLSVCSSYSSTMSSHSPNMPSYSSSMFSSPLEDHHVGLAANDKQVNSQDKTQADLVAQLLGQQLF
ncbi:hypothetical protein BGX21_000309 [Mortierella sp. AD011]|nr:hypothetical protein BGX20_005122 [Mortierella sp. AD010]KAF9401866.1 hypothetical protein BGX21_000309 [Mortierella sp. AD011]